MGADAASRGAVRRRDAHLLARRKIAYQFWQRYEYTQDEAWLRERAYPMLRGVAEFYRNFPNTKKGDDGKYHIHHVNSNESVRGAQTRTRRSPRCGAFFRP